LNIEVAATTHRSRHIMFLRRNDSPRRGE